MCKQSGPDEIFHQDLLYLLYNQSKCRKEIFFKLEPVTHDNAKQAELIILLAMVKGTMLAEIAIPAY